MKSCGSEKEPNILYYDNHLLVVFKPAGWLTQKDHTNRSDLESFVKKWIQKTFCKPGDAFLHCIHRLDRPVAGLVLFAKTSKALSRLNDLSRKGSILRWYLAEVEGHLAKSGQLEHYLVHGEHRALISTPENPHSKKATLTYQVLEVKEYVTLVRIELHTGRYHQIRAQFSAIGHPIVGDIRYGAKRGIGDNISLVCTDLQFIHPITKKEMIFQEEQKKIFC